MDTTKEMSSLTRSDRQLIAQYLRDMARDTHLLLYLTDASLCGDVAALLRARATRLETETDGAQAITPLPHGAPLYAQT